MSSNSSAIPDEARERIEHPSSHAGELETSRMLHIRPDLVREDEFDEFSVREPRLEALREEHVTFVPRWDAHMPASAGGETRESSAEKGEAVVEGAGERIADLLVALDEAEIDELFPYPDGS